MNSIQCVTGYPVGADELVAPSQSGPDLESQQSCVWYLLKCKARLHRFPYRGIQLHVQLRFVAQLVHVFQGPESLRLLLALGGLGVRS